MLMQILFLKHSPMFFFFRDLSKIADGIGSKLGRLISSIVAFIAGYVVGFILVWELALILMAVLPPIIIVEGVITTVGL